MKTMWFRAVVKNETGLVECPWFVYVENGIGGKTYACRFNSMRHATDIAAAMNRAWEEEGRLLKPDHSDD